MVCRQVEVPVAVLCLLRPKLPLNETSITVDVRNDLPLMPPMCPTAQRAPQGVPTT